MSSLMLAVLAESGQIFSNAVGSFHQTTMSMGTMFSGRTPSIETGTIGIMSNQLLFRPSGFERGLDDWVQLGWKPTWLEVNAAGTEALERRTWSAHFVACLSKEVAPGGGSGC